MTSVDPAAGLAALTPAEQADAAALLEAGLTASDAVLLTESLSAAEAEAVGLTVPKPRSSLVAAGTTACWSHYYYTNWDLYWTTVANSWMQLNWCGRGGSITSYSITNVGGTGTGLRYEGNSKSARNVGWEVRGVTTHEWDFYIGGVSKCMQVRGGATGLYSRSVSCSM